MIAYLNNEHYVVLTGKDEGQAEADAAYQINDPWALTDDQGKDIALADNVLGKGGFDRIRQLVFVSRQEYAPTNGIAVEGAIRDRYIAHNGAAGSLGNPAAKAEQLPDDRGQWQRFQSGAIFAADGQPAVLLAGPVWQKYQALGGVGKLGAPVADAI